MWNSEKRLTDGHHNQLRRATHTHKTTPAHLSLTKSPGRDRGSGEGTVRGAMGGEATSLDSRRFPKASRDMMPPADTEEVEVEEGAEVVGTAGGRTRTGILDLKSWDTISSSSEQ
jgi:hypothetical protein